MSIADTEPRVVTLRRVVVATFAVVIAATVFLVGNRTVLHPSETTADVTSDLNGEILWTGGACVDLQVRTAWWGWRTIEQGTISGNSDAQWSRTGNFHLITRVLKQEPCVAVEWQQVTVRLPDDADPGIYRLCDWGDTCTTVDRPG